VIITFNVFFLLNFHISFFKFFIRLFIITKNCYISSSGVIKADKANKQILDKLQVEKERGITVKVVRN